MKSIIFVTVSMGGGGTERVISILANWFCKQNISVKILTIADKEVAYELDQRIQIVNISKATGGSLSGRLKRLFAMRRFFKQDSEAGIIAMGTVAAMFTLLAHIGLKNAVIISERNDPNRLNHKPIKKTVRLIRNILYRQAASIICQTEDVREYFPKSLIRNCRVIPNPISSTILPAIENNNRNHNIISAGRLTEQKNHKLLIDTFCRFHMEHPEYHLIIYGQGDLEENLNEYVKQLKMEDYITIPGFCNNLYEELQNSSMYISTSNWEGISNSLIEALAFGIPTIATDCPVGGSRMFIKTMENGILVKTNDEEGLLRGMNKITEDKELAALLSRNAVEIRALLSEERIANMWLDALESRTK